MNRVFIEGVKTESRYNKVPRGMRTSQFVQCAGCDYRIYNMQVDIANEEAWRKGGSRRDYLSGFLMSPISSCKRRTKCLVGGFIILRGEKALPSPFLIIKRLLNQKTLYKLSKEEAKK